MEKYSQFNRLCSFIAAAGNADRCWNRNTSESKDQRNDNFPYDDYHSVDVVTDSYGTFMEMASQWKLWSDHFLGISTDWKKDGSFQYCDHCENSGDTGRAILFLAPALLLICCFTVIPIFEAVYTSFHKTQYAMVGEFVGLKNYISVMVESDGWKNIVNSIVYVVLSLLLAMPIGVGIGTLLNRKIRGMTIFRTMIIIPWTLSQTVTALLWKWLLNGNYGLITSWAYQLTGKKMDLFSTAIIAKILVVVVNVWNTVPVVIILTIAALQTISPELIEAAQVDGASRRMIYWKLTLPMIRPTMVTALVMQSIEYFNMVTLIYVLTAGGPFNATQTLSLAAYQNGFDYWHMDIAAAYSIIIFLLNIVFSLFYVRILKTNDN